MRGKPSGNRHLTDEQWLQCLLGEPPPEAAAHLSGCPNCQAELSRFREATTQLSRQTFGYAEALPERFWEEQQRRIGAWVAAKEAGTSQATFPRRLAVGLSVAAAGVLAVMLIRWPAPQPPQAMLPPAPSVAGAASADDQLLAQVQEALEREVPLALAPATLLAQEMESGMAQKPPQRTQ
jgi:hypothetical protein